MSSSDLWHLAGFVVLATLCIVSIRESRKARRAVELLGGDGTNREMLGQRVIYLREPAVLASRRARAVASRRARA
jgi:hypothetical protein